MKITFDQYSNKYFLTITDSNVVALTFEELEQLGESIHQLVQDEYSRALQADLFDDGGTCDGCTI